MININFTETTGRDNITVTLKRKEILVFVDPVAAGFQSEGLTVFTLKAQEGFGEVAELILHNQIQLSGYKIIALLIGRADL